MTVDGTHAPWHTSLELPGPEPHIAPAEAPTHANRVFDLEQLDRVLPGLRIDSLLLEPRRLDGMHARIAVTGLQLDHLRFPAPVVLRGLWAPGRIAVILTMHPGDRWIANGVPHTGASISVWTPDVCLDAYVPAGTHWVVLSLDRDRFVDDIGRHGLHHRAWTPGQPMHLPAHGLPPLLHALAPLLADDMARPEGEARILRGACNAVVAALGVSAGVAAPCAVTLRRHRLVQRAEAHMRAHLCEIIRMQPLSRAVGASERLLEYAFREMYDMGAIAFLRTIRFNGARKALLAASDMHTTVTRIAMDCGFSHLSEFAGKYRRLFGESPSDTLRRRVKIMAAAPTLH